MGKVVPFVNALASYGRWYWCQVHFSPEGVIISADLLSSVKEDDDHGKECQEASLDEHRAAMVEVKKDGEHEEKGDLEEQNHCSDMITAISE